MERSGSSESTGGNCPQKARVHVPTRMLSGFSAPKFHPTECGDEQGNNIQVRLGENAAGVSLACPSAAPPPAPVSIHNATFTATHCILLSLLSNESFVNSLNTQPGKEYNYSECQVGSQKIKKKKQKKTQTSTLIWRLPAQSPNRDSLPVNLEEKSSRGQSPTMSSQSVFLFIEVTHPENKPICMAGKKKNKKTCLFVEKSTKACILNFELKNQNFLHR